MQKEEFPTFLNEQPTVVFGRTTRELMVFLIGLSFAFVLWSNIGALFPGGGVGVIVLKVFFALIPILLAILVAFVKVGSRPLEEWALVGFFYFFTPKVFIYVPVTIDMDLEEDEAAAKDAVNNDEFDDAEY